MSGTGTGSADLDQDYAGAGYNRKLGFGAKPALILIDFVEAYFDKSSPLYADVDDTLASGLRVLEAARAARVPVIFTNVVFHHSGINGGIFMRKVPNLKLMAEGEPMGAAGYVSSFLSVRRRAWAQAVALCARDSYAGTCGE